MVRRHLGNGVRALFPPELEALGFLVAFTERTGGVSPAPYDSLNLGLQTADARGRAVQNRARVAAALGIDPFATAEQAHGSALARVGARRAAAGFSDPAGALPGADALVVSRPRLPVAVLVADCVPVAMVSPEEGRLVAVHAGWRGIVAGIVERSLAAFDRPAGVRAAIGPGIGPCHYEVGPEVAEAVATASGSWGVVERRGESTFVDLPASVASILRAAGVRALRARDACTACHPDRFFSHRRDGETGRQALIAMRL